MTSHSSPRPPDESFLYVETVSGLRRVVEQFADSPRFGLDTEFVGERTYIPQLELIQLANERVCAVLDCRAIARLDAFLPLLFDDRIEKILHAGQQDLELFATLTERVPGPIFDTQVAAAMVGYGAQPGYGQLVERLLGVVVDKTQTLTDWTHRPLSKPQLAYAADDVRHLLPLHDRLQGRLRELNREDWAREEFLRLQRTPASNRPPVREAYLRVRGRGTLRPKGLAILRELAAWREEEAQRRNRPRGSIIKDDLLVELARRAPATLPLLRVRRGPQSRELERSAEDIVAAVNRGLEIPKSDWPQPPRQARSAAPAGLVELLQAVLRARAQKAHIAPGLLATTADLELLAAHHGTAAAATLPILQGWRRKIAGEQLLRLLDGNAAVRVDPSTQGVRIDPAQG